ncbi:MAG: hypothetical protein HOP29_14655 [Phycisphaerales bacterium]|nr:hypothetical protein [Phycisphaerales bacterium]
MPNMTPEVDAYIKKSPDFARPVLTRLRQLFHKACPKIEEKLKWGVPSFEYKGMVGGMAAFKKHLTYGFWKAPLMKDPAGILATESKSAMFGSKVTSLANLPPDTVLIAYIKEAVQLNEDGVKLERPKTSRKNKNAIKAPDDLLAALKKSKKALATFEAFSYSCRKEYVEWVTEAKQEVTRRKRIATAVEWMAEGKPRNWKYMGKC